MAGSMRQRGKDSWLLSAYVGWDSIRKRRQYLTKTVRGTRREAERALADLVSEANCQKLTGVALHGETLRVVDVLTQWLDSRNQVLSRSTVDRYEIAIKHVQASSVGALPVPKLRPHHVEDLYSDLVRKGLSGSSIRKVHWALRQSLAWAHRRGQVLILATDGIELPPLRERELSPPASAEVRSLIDHALKKDPDWGTAIAFMAWTGCRRGEACGLRWRDVDLEAKTVLIARAVVAIPGGAEVKGTKTGEVRRIAIGARTAGLLREHRDRCDRRAGISDARLGEDAYVFSPSVDNSEPYNPHTFTRVFIEQCAAAGVPKMRLHDLRHHSATALLNGVGAL